MVGLKIICAYVCMYNNNVCLIYDYVYSTPA